MSRKNESGFTILEILIAMIVLVVGMLGLVTTAAMVSRMIGRSQRASVAAAYAQSRVEKMRPASCIAAQRVAGTDSLYRGSNWIAINSWSYIDLGNRSWRLQVVTRWKTTKNATRIDTLQLGVPCLT